MPSYDLIPAYLLLFTIITALLWLGGLLIRED